MPGLDENRRLIATYRRRLQKLKEKEALYGSAVDPGVSLEIEDIEDKIARLETALRHPPAGSGVSHTEEYGQAGSDDEKKTGQSWSGSRAGIPVIAGVILAAGGMAVLLYTMLAGNTSNPVETPVGPARTPAQELATATRPSLTGVVPAPANGAQSLHEIKVKGHTRQDDLCLEQGQAVSVEATGMINYDGTYGFTGPEGKDIGGNYNIAPDFPHAALICRLTGESEWRLCGTSATFIAPIQGCLEFNVNDIDPLNNKGAFTVKVEIE